VEWCVADLVRVFDRCFLATYNTCLVGGGEEPVYLPADTDHPHHRIIFRDDYFASALHEVAHWSIAGPERRLKVDFGYWYNPDGRTAEQQRRFFAVEVKPQALEWLFAKACGYPFRVSTDNINGEALNDSAFKDAVFQQVQRYCHEGVSERVSCFITALAVDFATGFQLSADRFARAELS